MRLGDGSESKAFALTQLQLCARGTSRRHAPTPVSSLACVPLLCRPRRTTGRNSSVPRSTAGTRPRFLPPPSNQQNEGFWKKQWSLGLGQEIDQKRRSYVVMPGRRERLTESEQQNPNQENTKQNKTKRPTHEEGVSKELRRKLRERPAAKSGRFEQEKREAEWSVAAVESNPKGDARPCVHSGVSTLLSK